MLLSFEDWQPENSAFICFDMFFNISRFSQYEHIVNLYLLFSSLRHNMIFVIYKSLESVKLSVFEPGR